MRPPSGHERSTVLAMAALVLSSGTLTLGCTTRTITAGSTAAPSPPSIEALPTIGTATLPPTSPTSATPPPFTTAPPRTTAPPPTTAPPTTAPADTTAQRPSTTPPRTTLPLPPTTAGEPLALDLLGFVTVANEHRGGYVRGLFGYPADIDHDGCNTRAEVLMRDTLAPVTHSSRHCTVVTGRWVSPYDGLTSTSAAAFAIDHVVALKEAWDSGAWAWSSAERFAYGNDLSDHRTLRAVSVASNDAKSDKDPSNWLPPSSGDVCSYVADWVSIKVRWQLTMDQSEFGRIRNLLRGPCAGTRVAPWSTPP